MVRLRYVPPVAKYNYAKIIATSLIVVSSVLIAGTIAGIILGVHKEHDTNKKFLRFYSDSNEFLIKEFRCKLPDIRPTPIKELKIKREKLQPCKNAKILTSIVSTLDYHDPLVLKLHPEYLGESGIRSKESVNCSYCIVHRKPGNDSETYLSEIQGYFSVVNDEIVLKESTEHIYVECLSNGEEFYRNLHAIIAKKRKFLQRQKETNIKKKKPYKILIVGLNGMSRINLHRGMPNTYKFLQGNEWFDFKGYTRLANESFGNVFTILTGQSADQRYKNCNPKRNTFLDDCDFIWKKFQEVGYITAFAEDQNHLSTFNAHHQGFRSQPTDYYFRPFILRAEKDLEVRRKDGLAFCLGQSLYMDHIFVNAMKIVSIHDNDPFFGFFYVNSLSDKQLSSSPILDNRISDSFVKTIEELNEPDMIVVYFGDRGIRFEESAVRLLFQ